MSMLHKAFVRLIACTFLAAVLLNVNALASTLGDYFEVASGVIPNKVRFSLSQEAIYRDNINSSPDKKEGYEFNTGLSVNWMRTFSNLTYGLQGTLNYTYETEDTDSDQDGFDWSINPRIIGSETFHITSHDQVMISLGSTSHNSKVDNSNTDYTRSTDYHAHILYDLIGMRHIGLATSLDYINTRYSKSTYKGYSRQRYGVSTAPYYKIGSRIRTGIRASYFETKYSDSDRQDDSNTISIDWFINYMITSKINATLEAGFGRTTYEGQSRDSHDSGDFTGEYSFRLSYVPNDRMSFQYHTSYNNEDTFVTSRGGRVSWSNAFGWSWDLSTRFSLNNSISIDSKDEKNGSTLDSLEYSYECRLTYSLSQKCSVYSGYELSNVRFKYENNRNYTENKIRLGLSYSF